MNCKSGPISGAAIQRGEMVGVSGKAMEVAIPRGTALREMFKRSDSEGHCFEVAASLLHEKEALAEPKAPDTRLGSHETISD
jgi:hypothetical protein